MKNFQQEFKQNDWKIKVKKINYSRQRRQLILEENLQKKLLMKSNAIIYIYTKTIFY